MQRSDELDAEFLALTLSDCPDAVAMDTDACEPYDPGPEPPAAETDFSWMLAAQFRKLHCAEDLDMSTRAIASSSVHSGDLTMESCLPEEAEDLDAEISVTLQERKDIQKVGDIDAKIVTLQEAEKKEEAGDPDAETSVVLQEAAMKEEACVLGAKISVTQSQSLSLRAEAAKKVEEASDVDAEINVPSQGASQKKTEPHELAKDRQRIGQLSQTGNTCSVEPKTEKSTRMTQQDKKCSELETPKKEDCSKLQMQVKKRATTSNGNKSSASSPLSSGSCASSLPDNGSSGFRTCRKRSLDSGPSVSGKRACPQFESLVRVSLRTLGSWLQPADVAVLLVPFCFPHEPRLLFLDSSFASGPGWEGPGRPRQLVVPLARRKELLEFYSSRPPRVWAPLPHHVAEVNSLESWRLHLEGLDDVPNDFLPRRLSQLPPEPKQHFEGALRWASTFARTSRGLLRHLHRCARVPRPRRPSENFVVELRVENGPEDQVVLHAVRHLIQGLAPYSGLIFRSRGDAPGWTNLHVEITGGLRDALILIAATNRRSLVFVRDMETYVLAPGGLSRLQSWMVPPQYIQARFSRTVNRLGPKKSRLALLQNLLRHLLISRPAPILPACCMDLVVRLGVCADDANLVARILVTGCRSVRDYGPEIASGCLSGFQLDGAGFMCCAEDAGLIELASQLIYCPCSTCTPFLYERGQIEPPSAVDLM